ncbi:oxygenase MpaB family protein [Nocardia sp. NPDC050406]|uniref:oxygenase MpaB family protein n=1 Tax=Nocardia sp. NPDC050406 TaxID=3364318 RepID=UPI0037999BAA
MTTATSRGPTPAPVPPPTVVARNAMTGLPTLVGAAAANIIMQLSFPTTAYGVYESKVESGDGRKHPVKRLRTTLTYMAVAMIGTDDDRQRYRTAVNGAHRYVRSDEDSPVKYNAFDPELQLWITACLYVYFRDMNALLYGPPDDVTADALYQEAMRIGTTLQMRPDMWPTDRAAFEEYWTAMLGRIEADDTIRAYMRDVLLGLGPLPWPVRTVLAPANRFLARGYLYPEFREMLGLPWTDRDQRRFEQTLRAVGRVFAAAPESIRLFPYNVCLWDMRRRARQGKPLI